jgi:hypothetical protein
MKLPIHILGACGALALAATGCVGEFEPMAGGGIAEPDGDADADTGTGGGGGGAPGGGGGNAEAAFQEAFPFIKATCGANGAGCHASVNSPQFVSDGNSYGALMAQQSALFPGFNSATAKIVTYGATIPHAGGSTFYAAGGSDAVAAWLAAEKTAAESGGGPGAGGGGDLVAQWSGCMELADWEADQVAQAWANKNSGDGNCEQCHNLGEEGFVASDQSARMFESVSTRTFFLGDYFAVDAAGAAMVINSELLAKVGRREAGYLTHPNFNLDPNENAMVRLTSFYNKTKARMDAGQCGESKLVIDP